MRDELPIVLHVGAPKAGSSALQYDLTWNPRRLSLDRAEVTYEYVALNARGQLRRGRGLAEMASRFAAHYANSASLESIFQIPARRLADCLTELRAMRAGGIVPVMSYELWLHADAALVARFARALEAPLQIVAYVRDPVSWLISAYWQRHQAEAAPIDQWIASYLPLTRWADHLSAWRSLPDARLTVRPLEGSVPADFCRLLGCEPSPPEIRHNTALPGPFARFLTRHALPATTSVSELKFAWSRWVARLADGDSRLKALGGLPAVIDDTHLATIIDGTRDASECLLALCDESSAASISADRRWWSSTPADHRLGDPAAASPPSDPAAAATATDELLALALEATAAADGAWRKAAHELDELRGAEAERAARCLELERLAALTDHARQQAEHRCLEREHRCRELEHRCEHLAWELGLTRQRVAKLERRGCLPHPWRKAG